MRTRAITHHSPLNWNLSNRQNVSFRTSAHYFRGNLHRISDYLSSSIRRGRVPVPRNSETCMGRDGKPVPYDAFTVGPTNSQFVYLPSKTDMHIILYLSKLYIFHRAPPVRAGNIPGQKISVFLPNTLDKIQIRRYSMMCLYLETFPESGKCRSGENTANPFGTKILS